MHNTIIHTRNLPDSISELGNALQLLDAQPDFEIRLDTKPTQCETTRVLCTKPLSEWLHDCIQRLHAHGGRRFVITFSGHRKNQPFPGTTIPFFKCLCLDTMQLVQLPVIPQPPTFEPEEEWFDDFEPEEEWELEHGRIEEPKEPEPPLEEPAQDTTYPTQRPLFETMADAQYLYYQLRAESRNHSPDIAQFALLQLAAEYISEIRSFEERKQALDAMLLRLNQRISEREAAEQANPQTPEF